MLFQNLILDIFQTPMLYIYLQKHNRKSARRAALVLLQAHIRFDGG